MNGVADRILITGGGGFIGSNLAHALLEAGHRVRVLDLLDPQVHGALAGFPPHLRREVEAVQGDVRDRDTVRRALAGVGAVYHFASAVGVGQSMYELVHYTSTNNMGTANLLECLIEHPVERLVVASSMSIYGEGLYRRADGATLAAPARPAAALAAGIWDPTLDGERLEPVPTPETKMAEPASVYALSKYDQEKMCLMVGGAYRIPTLALRFFNVYGPYQSLSNPYTGVLAIFASRCLNGNAPLIFEDGGQRRDFVHVRDVARACIAALTTRAVGEAFNVGSGRHRTILEVARAMIDVLGLHRELEPVVTGKHRVGDVRHCYADIGKARLGLGFEPRVDFHDGLAELAEWLDVAEAVDNAARASAELERRGLTL